MRKLLILAIAGTCALLAACNTIEGAGKDMTAAGKAVSRTASDAKH
jgi:predicted small secreted protein